MEAGVREPLVNGDSEQLKQVFFNIIGNAIEAINSKSEIKILSGLEDRFVFVKIIDHGSGISKDDLSKAKITVTDINGKQISRASEVQIESSKRILINSTNWSNGLYFVSIVNNNKEIIKKILKN